MHHAAWDSPFAVLTAKRLKAALKRAAIESVEVWKMKKKKTIKERLQEVGCMVLFAAVANLPLWAIIFGWA